MPVMIIHTYLRGRKFPNYPHWSDSYVDIWEQESSPCVSKNGGGYASLEDMQWQLAERRHEYNECLLIENGIRITPHTGYGNGEHHQDIIYAEADPTPPVKRRSHWWS